MVVSTDADRVEAAKPIRAHGWPREMDDRKAIAAQYPEFDERYLFLTPGLNVRPTELQGAFGIHQMDRLEEFVEHRRANAHRLNEALADYDDLFRHQSEQDGGRHTYYGYPLLVRENAPFSRDEFATYLEDHGIETRPIMGGNLAQHPAFEVLERRAGDLETAQAIHDRGLFFGNHHHIHEAHIAHIVGTIENFVSEVSKS